MKPATLESLPQEASRILKFADGKGVVLRLLGGVAIHLRCPSARLYPLSREYGDLDFVAHRRHGKQVREIFPQLGYHPREVFNALQGHTRLIFNDHARSRRTDVFLDQFEMCHKLDFTDRLELEELTLPLADLLATKLQVVELNEKDVKDILSILLDYEVRTDGALPSVDGGYLAKLCADDWGLYKTFSTNLSRVLGWLDSLHLTGEQADLLHRRIDELATLLAAQPKSLKWRIRASVGEKVRWYELPVSDKDAPD